MTPIDQDRRERDFRSGVARLFVTTGPYSARNIMSTISIIINYDMPASVEQYLQRYRHFPIFSPAGNCHRCHPYSRCGRPNSRFPRRSLIVTLVANSEQERLAEIERYYQTVISELPLDLSDLV